MLPHLFQVNGCTGKMGKAVINAADSAGLNLIPLSFGSEEESGKTVQVNGKDILVHGPANREKVLASVFDGHPNLIVIDYTVPSAVNGNYYSAYYFVFGGWVFGLCWGVMGVLIRCLKIE